MKIFIGKGTTLADIENQINREMEEERACRLHKDVWWLFMAREKIDENISIEDIICLNDQMICDIYLSSFNHNEYKRLGVMLWEK